MVIKNYNGYGNAHHIQLYGHVFEKELPRLPASTKGGLYNILYLFRCFNIKPIPGLQVVLQKESQKTEAITEDDGFFSMQWEEPAQMLAGWQKMSTQVAGAAKDFAANILVPHSTQFAFISDIDDTILISFSGSPLKKIWELLSRSPAKRRLFKDVSRHYNLLTRAHTTSDAPNPFFYVSSSEWNLYDYLQQLFGVHNLPEGVFLLNQVKQLHQLFKTGIGNHEGKLLRIIRIFEALPIQRFVLFGDNTQQDPSIYLALAEKYPQRIYAVYIRSVSKNKIQDSQVILDAISAKKIHTCFFEQSNEAIAHSEKIGLIVNNVTVT